MRVFNPSRPVYVCVCRPASHASVHQHVGEYEPPLTTSEFRAVVWFNNVKAAQCGARTTACMAFEQILERFCRLHYRLCRRQEMGRSPTRSPTRSPMRSPPRVRIPLRCGLAAIKATKSLNTQPSIAAVATLLTEVIVPTTKPPSLPALPELTQEYRDALDRTMSVTSRPSPPRRAGAATARVRDNSWRECRTSSARCPRLALRRRPPPLKSAQLII